MSKDQVITELGVLKILVKITYSLLLARFSSYLVAFE